MLDFTYTAAAFYALLAVSLASQARVSPASARRGLGVLAIAFAVTIANAAAVLSGLSLQTGETPGWNWLGKLLAVATSLVIVACLPRAWRADAGVAWRWTTGWVVPVIAATAVLCAFSWGLQAALTPKEPFDGARFAYQALMPGLDEELFYRGLLLAILLQAFARTRPVGGAHLGWAALIVTALFAIAHGLRLTPAGVEWSPLVLAVTGLIGFGLVWIRLRCGNIYAPLLVHNLINAGNGFF